MKLDIAIIGGGLAGLSLAQALMPSRRSIAVFEARERFGGRVLSLPEDQPFRYDLGPSWIWPELQPRLARFLASHEIEIFPQWCVGTSLYQSDRSQPAQAYVDQGTYAGARRIRGGMYRLIEALLQALPRSLLMPGYQLNEVIDNHDHIELGFEYQSKPVRIQARRAILTIPPRLLASSIKFHPVLDAHLHEVMSATPTWMAGHAKALIRYRQSFWREAGLSGSALAAFQGAAMAEIFDASSHDGTHAALSGFMGIPAELRRQYRDDLEALLLEQLVRLFGKAAAQPEEIRIMDWCDESFTADPADAELPVGHPQCGHPRLLSDQWNNKLYFAGTETASDYGGYLEGALESAERVFESLMKQ